MNIKETNAFIESLKIRFEKNLKRHPFIKWDLIESILTKNKHLLNTVYQMEESGGEPDVIVFENNKSPFYVDCSIESPLKRRSLCYDKQALIERKENKPIGSAVELANKMEIDLLTETDYFTLQKYGPFDTKTSSWILTPNEVRKLGGAIFGDYKFGRTFIYHNGAQSYYAARGFRGKIEIK